MGVDICTVGGYEEVGKNMTAIKIDDVVILCDMGLDLGPYIQISEREDAMKVPVSQLTKLGAIPNTSFIKDWKPLVKAIIPSHAHLDHIGAVPFLSKQFNAPIFCTPFSASFLNAVCHDEKINLKNDIMVINPNAKYKLTKDITIEFIHITHSTLQCVMVALHTKYGVIIYANDFKLDASPVLGKPANIKRLRELGDSGNVLLLIAESTYAHLPMKCPSESVARELLRDVLLCTDAKGSAIVVTTFSSHLARLKSIIEIGSKLERKIVFLGRSLAKYIYAAESINLIKFSNKVEIVKYGRKIRRRLRQIMEEGPEKYLLVVTGNQGEPRATLAKMTYGKVKFKFRPEDHVIFSSKVIPTEVNRKDRAEIEAALKHQKIRIFRDIHVSGHGAREDLRDLLKLVRPKILCPAHGEVPMREAFADLALREMGYAADRVILPKNGERVNIV